MGGMVMAGLAVCGGAGSGQKTRGKGGGRRSLEEGWV